MFNLKRTAVTVTMAAAIAIILPFISSISAKNDNLNAASDSVSGIISQEKSLSERLN